MPAAKYDLRPSSAEQHVEFATIKAFYEQTDDRYVKYIKRNTFPPLIC